MIALNAYRLWDTWGAYKLDGMEQLGFPIAFWERGGFVPHQNFYFHFLAIDIAVAVASAYLFSYALRDGWSGTLHRIQTWGLDHIYDDRDENAPHS